LRGQELNSVMEQTPAVAQAIARGLGITIGQLRKFAEEGKLTAEAVVTALKDQGSIIDDEFTKIPPTYGQALQVFGTGLSRVVNEVDQALGISSTLVSSLLKQGRKLNEIAPSIGIKVNAISEAIKKAKIQIKELLGIEPEKSSFSFFIEELSKGINTFAKTIKNAFDPIFNFGKNVLNLFEEIYIQVVGNSYWPDTIDGVIFHARRITGALKPIENFAYKVDSLFSKLSGIDFNFDQKVSRSIGTSGFSGLQNLLSNITKEGLVKGGALAIPLLIALFKGVNPFLALAGVLATVIGGSTIEGIEQAFNSLGTSLREISGIAGAIAGQLVANIVTQIPAITAALLEAITGAGAQFVTTILESIPLIGSGLSGLFKTVNSLVGGLIGFAAGGVLIRLLFGGFSIEAIKSRIIDLFTTFKIFAGQTISTKDVGIVTQTLFGTGEAISRGALISRIENIRKSVLNLTKIGIEKIASLGGLISNLLFGKFGPSKLLNNTKEIFKKIKLNFNLSRSFGNTRTSAASKIFFGGPPEAVIAVATETAGKAAKAATISANAAVSPVARRGGLLRNILFGVGGLSLLLSSTASFASGIETATTGSSWYSSLLEYANIGLLGVSLLGTGGISVITAGFATIAGLIAGLPLLATAATITATGLIGYFLFGKDGLLTTQFEYIKQDFKFFFEDLFSTADTIAKNRVNRVKDAFEGLASAPAANRQFGEKEQNRVFGPGNQNLVIEATLTSQEFKDLLAISRQAKELQSELIKINYEFGDSSQKSLAVQEQIRNLDKEAIQILKQSREAFANLSRQVLLEGGDRGINRSLIDVVLDNLKSIGNQLIQGAEGADPFANIKDSTQLLIDRFNSLSKSGAQLEDQEQARIGKLIARLQRLESTGEVFLIPNTFAIAEENFANALEKAIKRLEDINIARTRTSDFETVKNQVAVGLSEREFLQKITLDPAVFRKLDNLFTRFNEVNKLLTDQNQTTAERVASLLEKEELIKQIERLTAAIETIDLQGERDSAREALGNLVDEDKFASFADKLFLIEEALDLGAITVPEYIEALKRLDQQFYKSTLNLQEDIDSARAALNLSDPFKEYADQLFKIEEAMELGAISVREYEAELYRLNNMFKEQFDSQEIRDSISNLLNPLGVVEVQNKALDQRFVLEDALDKETISVTEYQNALAVLNAQTEDAIAKAKGLGNALMSISRPQDVINDIESFFPNLRANTQTNLLRESINLANSQNQLNELYRAGVIDQTLYEQGLKRVLTQFKLSTASASNFNVIMSKTFKDMAENVNRSLASNLSSVLKGEQGLSEAIDGILDSVTNSIIDNFSKGLADSITSDLGIDTFFDGLENSFSDNFSDLSFNVSKMMSSIFNFLSDAFSSNSGQSLFGSIGSFFGLGGGATTTTTALSGPIGGYGFGITASSGGMVPGGIGLPVPAIVHGGEMILNPKQQAALFGKGAGNNVTVQITNQITGDVSEATRREVQQMTPQLIDQTQAVLNERRLLATGN